MTQINFGRLEYEITNRLRGEFRNPVAERLLKDRCLDAVKLRTINKPNLFDEITTPFHVIGSNQVENALKSTGILDLVSICINAQQQEETR